MKSKLQQFKLHYEHDVPYRAIRTELRRIIRRKTTKKEKTEVKTFTFYKSTKFKITTTIILTAAATAGIIYTAYQIRTAIYNEGYSAALQQQKIISKEAASMLKQPK